ncbi:hypothetical protein GCM10010464_80120 [Pseudonocardia yunnanensis]|uniref:Uncharacterized protein n=1 Tax=Pseudonocardia yunnanensis TaxID=58107 RepID=A0ABW4ESN5_9PSEU
MTAESEPVPVPEEPPVSFGLGRVGRDLGTYIGNTSGPTHSGLGDQYNSYFGSGDILKRIRQQPLGEEAQRLELCFVEPPGWKRATAMLAVPGAVLLHGRPGSGIRSAALRLLSLCGGRDGGPTRELLPDSRDDSYADLLRLDDVVEGDRLLFDLLDNHERLPIFQREFPWFREAIRERKAYLAVVLPRDRPWTIEPELRRSVAPLGRPDGMGVLYRHLQADGIEYVAGARHVEVENWASRVPMRDIALLASNVGEARLGDPSASFDDWFERAWNASATASKVADEIRGYREKRLLPLMLATATFEGCPVDTVFAAEWKLLELLEYPPGEVHELDRPDMADRVQAIAAQTGPNRRVRFMTPGHGPAALKHFWVNYPGLRDNFRDWITACGGMEGLDETDWRSAARRFAEQCLHVGRTDDLIRAASEWATSSRAGMTSAEELLVRGLRHADGGRQVRQKFYDWSKDSQLQFRPGVLGSRSMCSGDRTVPARRGAHPASSPLRPPRRCRGFPQCGRRDRGACWKRRILPTNVVPLGRAWARSNDSTAESQPIPADRRPGAADRRSTPEQASDCGSSGPQSARRVLEIRARGSATWV